MATSATNQPTDREQRETQEAQRCAKCGLERQQWVGNNRQGFALAGQPYCCQGCAIGTGCTCR